MSESRPCSTNGATDVAEPSAAPTKAGDGLSRRDMLIGSVAAAGGLLGYQVVSDQLRGKSPVFIARGQRYDGDLTTTIRDGLLATGLDVEWLRGRRVLLKPNMVEPRKDRPQMTTHPAVLHAAIEVFLKLGAEVVVGEAPGHVRDTEMALVESGLIDVIDEHRVEFADLNYEESKFMPNVGMHSKLPGIWFSGSVVSADLVVSLPKMKTHHWVGVTCSMKNLYGILPGCRYGWPKNVLHHAGIPETVADIHATLTRKLAIVDGIVCMEGDGPILGTAKPMGLIVVGQDLTAVDATCARIMGIDPTRIDYLRYASKDGGALQDKHIEQRGEHWSPLVSPFQVMDLPHLRSLRPKGELITKRYPCGKLKVS